MSRKHITVRGIRKGEIDADQLALVYWLMAKRAVEEKRERDLADKRRRRSVQNGGSHAER